MNISPSDLQAAVDAVEAGSAKPRTMRAKFKVTKVTLGENGEVLEMSPVCKTGAYPADGTDEDNTYAKFSPSGALSLAVMNPALFGQFRPGQKFYLDFTEAVA